MRLGFGLVMRQAKVTVGVRFAILFATVFFVVAALCGTGVEAVTYHLTPADDWISVIGYDPSQPGPLALLQPGDKVILHEGTCEQPPWSFKLRMYHQGTAAQPIVIRAAEGERAVLTRTNASQNVINIMGARHLILRGLEITGGVDSHVSAGIRIGSTSDDEYIGTSSVLQPHPGDQASFVTIEDSHIHHTGEAAITANFVGDTNTGMIFRRNEINNTGGTGEGFYLGSNNDAQGTTKGVFRDGLIEFNYIHDLDGPTVSQGDGIEIKDGSYNNVIRHNVIHNTKYPGILVYGTDGQAPNIIEQNVVWNPGNHGIQVASNAIVRNNLVFMNVDAEYHDPSNATDAIRSQPHQSAVPGNLEIIHNTIVSHHSGIRVHSDNGTLSGPIVIANNAIYAQESGTPDWAIRVPQSSDPQTTLLTGNVGVGTACSYTPPPNYPITGCTVESDQFDSAGDLVADLVNANWEGSALDAFPAPGSALIGAADPAYATLNDFNGVPRGGSLDVGAYVFDSNGNPGWTVASEFKVAVPEPPTPGNGDYNGNGVVDAADYTLWRDTLGSQVDLRADGNDDGTVDEADYVFWKDRFGNLTGTGSRAAVPEPATLVLLGLVGLIVHG